MVYNAVLLLLVSLSVSCLADEGLSAKEVCKQSMCENGWTPSGAKCYKYFDEMLNWESARDKCKQVGGLLAMPKTTTLNWWLHDVRDQNGGKQIWIGLQSFYKSAESAWRVLPMKWVDGEKSNNQKIKLQPGTVMSGHRIAYEDFSSFRNVNATLVPEHCWVMRDIKNGQHWNDVECKNKNYFICEKEIAKTTPDECLCIEGYTKYGDSCYMYHATPLIWENANWRCKVDGASLALPYSPNKEVIYIRDQVNDVSSDKALWMGLRRGKDGKFRWQNECKTVYGAWSSNEDCVGMRSKKYGEGNLAGISCDTKWPFVCQYEIAKTTPDECLCDEEWTTLGETCFKYHSTPTTWDNANRICKKSGSLLTLPDSLHTSQEVSYIRDQANDYSLSSDIGVWMGLRRGTDGIIYYQNDWKTTRNSNPAPGSNINLKDGDCVGMSSKKYGEGNWYTLSCDTKWAFVCQKHLKQDAVFYAPFSTKIPNGLRKGQKIVVHGKPIIGSWTSYQQSRFSINLVCGENMAHSDVAFKFDIGISGNKWFSHRLFDSKMDGQWQNAITKLPVWHFKRMEPFKMTILVEENQYKIALNDTHYANFSHRIPIKRVTHLEIQNDVLVTKIQFL